LELWAQLALDHRKEHIRRTDNDLNNIWRGNLSFIQSFDNLVNLISGSVAFPVATDEELAAHLGELDWVRVGGSEREGELLDRISLLGEEDKRGRII
jgi:hypothetical protein